MATSARWLRQFLVAALCSALASLMIVAVGPGFSKPGKAEGRKDKAPASQSRSGGGSDHDGDADSNPATADEDDHTTADDGDNAHPSGKDRSVERGKSGNQGRSESNPDDSKGPQRYEGERGDDKPSGPGGTDRDDQDGNNGCGNDDDFDDDNNGWCGKPKESKAGKSGAPTTVAGATAAKEAPAPAPEEGTEEGDEVLADTITNDQPDEDESDDEVAAAAAERESGSALPFTGASVVPYVLIGLQLVGAGFLISRARRKSS